MNTRGLTLVLLASALLLSGGKSGAQNLGLRPSAQTDATLSEQRNGTPQDRQTAARPRATALPEQAPSPTHSEVGHYGAVHVKSIRQNGFCEWAKWFWSIVSGITALEVFNLLLVVGTFLLARFTYQLVHADRPFLIPEKQSLASRWPSLADFEKGDLDNLTAQLTLRNCGKGPAIIDEAVGRLLVVDGRFFPSADKFDDCFA